MTWIWNDITWIYLGRRAFGKSILGYYLQRADREVKRACEYLDGAGIPLLAGRLVVLAFHSMTIIIVRPYDV